MQPMQPMQQAHWNMPMQGSPMQAQQLYAADASPKWVTGHKFGARRCRNGRGCRNRTCGFAHPVDWQLAQQQQQQPQQQQHMQQQQQQHVGWSMEAYHANAQANANNAAELRPSAAIFVPTGACLPTQLQQQQASTQPTGWWAPGAQWGGSVPCLETTPFGSPASFEAQAENQAMQQPPQQRAAPPKPPLDIESADDDDDIWGDSASPSPASVLGSDLMAMLDEDSS